jgi:hypothetical protein
MGKLADAIAANTMSHGPECRVAAVLGKLTKADQADLHAAVADISLPATAIGRGLRSLGHTVSDSQLQRHRRGECACPR